MFISVFPFYIINPLNAGTISLSFGGLLIVSSMEWVPVMGNLCAYYIMCSNAKEKHQKHSPPSRELGLH